MKCGYKEFKECLYIEAEKRGIVLSDNMLEKFTIYKDNLIEWNKIMNLTAITDEYEIILKHFVDSLEVIKYIKLGENIIDIGTGAGFPGLVIAIYFEDKVNITLLDSLNKRLIFLQDVITKLGLKNVKLIHGRAEEVANNKEYRSRYNIVVSRAVAPLNILLEYIIPYLRIGGKCLLLKGDNARAEIVKSSNALKILNSKITNIYEYNYLVNQEKYNRTIIEVQKDKEITLKYPRAYGRIKKEPL